MIAVVGLLFSTAVTAQNQNSLTAECWLDNDISTKQEITSGENIDISNLLQGLHSLTIRVKDADDLWSSPLTKYFVLTPNGVNPTQITAKEYWFDNDVAHKQSLAASVTTISLAGLNQGLHSFTMRVMNDAGVWSSPLTNFFIVPPGADIEGGVTISRYIYWIDDGINDNNYVSGSLSSSSDIVAVDLSSVEEGSHTLSWMVGDSKGTWSQIYNEEFEYEPPTIVTGIEGTETDAAEDSIYDLQGRRVKTVKKGLYIINGKVVAK